MKPSSTLVKAVVALTAALWLSGCKLPAPDAEADAGARKAYEQVVANDLAGLQAHAGEELKGPDAAQSLAGIRQMLPPGKPPEGRLVGWNINTSVGVGSTATLTYAYDYPGRTVQVRMAMSRNKKGQPWLVRGVNVDVDGAPPRPAPGNAPKPDTKDI